MLHRNWELATEEQRARIDVMKTQINSDKDVPVHITFQKRVKSMEEVKMNLR